MQSWHPHGISSAVTDGTVSARRSHGFWSCVLETQATIFQMALQENTDGWGNDLLANNKTAGKYYEMTINPKGESVASARMRIPLFITSHGWSCEVSST